MNKHVKKQCKKEIFKAAFLCTCNKDQIINNIIYSKPTAIRFIGCLVPNVASWKNKLRHLDKSG